MANLDEKTIKAFCEHCDWAYQCWMFRRHLYDENPMEKLLKHPNHCYFFTRLEKILQEYWLLEVVKLHDPARQFGSENLTVEYVLETGKWPQSLKIELNKLKIELDTFAGSLRSARNKLLSHKDKKAILSGKALGEFKQGEDESYFNALMQFASLAHNHITGIPYLFDDFTESDVSVFMETFSKGLA